MSDHFREIKANKSLSKILFCIHANKIYDIFPAFTTREEKRLNGALLLLTPEQIDILHLEDKHVTIDYQESIISRTQAKDNLPESELLYYLFYDSRSALLNEM